MRRSKAWALSDLLGAVLLAIAALLLAATGGPAWARIPVGLLSLFAPGWALSWLLWPASPRPADAAGVGARGLAWLERSGLAALLGLALDALAGLALNATPLGVTALSVAGTLAALTIGMAIPAAWRRAALPDGGPGRPVRWPRVGALEAALLVAVLLSAAGLAYVLATGPLAGPPGYAGLYMLGPKGDKACFPALWRNTTYLSEDEHGRPCLLGNGTIAVAAANHQGHPADYRLVTGWSPAGPVPDQAPPSFVVDRTRSFHLEPAPDGLAPDAQFTWTLDLPPPPRPGDWRFDVFLYSDAAPETALSSLSLRIQG